MLRTALTRGVLCQHVVNSGSDERNLTQSWSRSHCIFSQAFWAHPPALCSAGKGRAVALASSIATL